MKKRELSLPDEALEAYKDEAMVSESRSNRFWFVRGYIRGHENCSVDIIKRMEAKNNVGS